MNWEVFPEEETYKRGVEDPGGMKKWIFQAEGTFTHHRLRDTACLGNNIHLENHTLGNNIEADEELEVGRRLGKS
jgi:hypothetical protein